MRFNCSMFSCFLNAKIIYLVWVRHSLARSLFLSRADLLIINVRVGFRSNLQCFSCSFRRSSLIYPRSLRMLPALRSVATGKRGRRALLWMEQSRCFTSEEPCFKIDRASVHVSYKFFKSGFTRRIIKKGKQRPPFFIPNINWTYFMILSVKIRHY